MKRFTFLVLLLLFTFFIAPACGTSSSNDNDSDVETEDSDNATDDSDSIAEPTCKTPGDAPVAVLFTEVTEELGFATGEMEIVGAAVASIDFDFDGFPDLVVSTGGKARDDAADPKGYYRLLRNNGVGGFEDVTFTSGLFTARSGHEGRESSYIVWGDVDNDGFTDAIHIRYHDKNGEEPYDNTDVYINKGDGTFKPGPKNDFVLSYFNPIAGAAVADFNRDGNLDLFLGRHYGEYGNLGSCEQDSIYNGSGDGGFENKTAGSGLETKPFSEETALAGTNHKPTWGVAACDIDGDGWTDILSTAYGRQFNSIYRNDKGAFKDLSVASNFAYDANENYNDNQYFTCYCASHTDAGEYCADAEDPLISCDGMENAFRVGTDDQPWRLGGNSSASVCADFNGDGNMDVVAVELAHWHIGQSSDKTQLLRNDGWPEKPFTRLSEEESGITRKRSGSWNDGDLGGLAADFDSDGRMDLLVLSSDYPGTTALLYQQQQDGTFSDISKTAGVKLDRAHGATVLDYDRDGDLDLVMGTSLMRWSATDNPPSPGKAWVHIYRNDTPVGNRIAILLRGDPEQGSNTDAIGARIIVTAGGKKFIREIQSSYGIWGFSNSYEQIIGIGNECQIDSIEVRWPDKTGSVTTITDIKANYRVVISQKSGEAEKTATLD